MSGELDLQTLFKGPSSDERRYASVILPLAVPKVYSYSVPVDYFNEIQIGIRVEVPLRNKLYAGLVVNVSIDDPGYRTRHIISVIDKEPVIGEIQIKFWKWISEYYACYQGEVMNVAMPSGLKLSSETRLLLHPENRHFDQLSDKEYLIAEALTIQEEISIDQVRDILNQKTVYPIIKNLLEQKILYIKEELKHKYKPKLISCVAINEESINDSSDLNEVFKMVERSERQTNALLSILDHQKKLKVIPASVIYAQTGIDISVLRALEKKGLISVFKKEVSRLHKYEEDDDADFKLTDAQGKCLEKIQQYFVERKTVLLHGVTGSGKTLIYISLIRKILENQGQVLYLLPEIALTTQIVDRLSAIFGNDIAVYHSRLNNQERVELWQSCLNGKPIILGARSALFLPFKDLKLIVVDEEHDGSYKQADPNPRYNARDAAIKLADICLANVLLGTATPSLESYHNVETGKYGYVQIMDRYGNSKLPEIKIVDLIEAQKTKQLKSIFTFQLLDEIKNTLDKQEQVLLFQNRRGYAPTLRCKTCHWHAECLNCDVSLTLHQYLKELKCHYCGFRRNIPESCPRCGSSKLVQLGFGTEKIEDLLKTEFPAKKIARMDYDTVRTRSAHERIIRDFEGREIDILVGTQMITKGLDFENVGLVGILNASKLLRFPDFRSAERAFQLMVQVAGRAGRKEKKGKVMIQTSDAQHPVIVNVLENDFDGFAARELSERARFLYPPYYRMIELTIKHKKSAIVVHASNELANILKSHLGKRVIGPSIPMIPRLRAMYQRAITIKMEKNSKAISDIKAFVLKAKNKIQSTEGMKTVRINIDVDPM